MATLLKDRSTYWVRTNGSSHNAYFDYRSYWKIYYEQSEADKKLLRTKLIIDYYKQTYWDGVSLGIADTTNSNVYINGTSIGTVSMTTNESNGEGTKLAKKGSKTTYIYHDKTTGEASFTFKGTGFGKSTAVSTYSLPKINVVTTIENNSSSSNYIDFGSNVTFTLTKPNDTHNSDIYYVINNTTYQIATNTSETSVQYAFPPDLISNYPNNSNISLIVYCKNLTSGLVRETTVYLKVPDTYKPSISVTTNDTNSICKNWGIYVKSKSILEVVISASGVSGSTIKSYSSNIGDYNSSLQSFTTSPLNPTITSGNTATMTLTSKVTDSREKTNSVSKNFVVYNYFAPTFVKCELVRCNSDGTNNNVGTYAKVVCQYKVASCNNKNAKSLVVSHGSTSKTFTLSSYEGTVESDSTQLFGAFDISKSYNFTFNLTDSFGTISQSVVLKNSYITRSFKAGGKGVTFGNLATEDGFHDYMGAKFHNGLEVVGNLKAGLAFSQDPSNSFQTSLFGTNKKGYRLQTIRSEMDGVAYFPNDSCGLAYTAGDTHGFLFTQYSGKKAWIGAGGGDKLNWVNQVEWKENRNKIMGIYEGSTTISSTAHVKLTLTESVKNGTLLSISNGGIRIGAGISKVKVSGNVYFSTGVQEGDSIRSFIYLNDTSIVHNFNRAGGTYEDRPIAPFLVNVSEGDILYLYGGNSTNGRGIITANSYMVVEVVE